MTQDAILGELDHTGMQWRSSKANPILFETTDCIQSTDYPTPNKIYSLIWSPSLRHPIAESHTPW